jgi:hypothetical protein
VLSTEATEVLQDLAAISQVQDALEESEDGETDYMEVMEYLRVAPLLLFSETKKAEVPRLPNRRCINRVARERHLPMIHIPKAEYSRRRKALMAQMEPNSIAILPAAAVAIRNRDVEHVYRQDSDFQYLSGFPEPQAVIVLMPGREHGEYMLFCRERNAERELWDGLRAGQEGAIRDFGADDAFPITDIDDILPGPDRRS